jgi:hypothetical protein
MNQVQRLYSLLENKQPVFVRNRTGRKKGVPTKLIMLQIVGQSGVQKSIKIPATRFPIPISTMVAPPSLLGDSQDFIDLLNKKELELIEPETATKELSDPNVSKAVESALAKAYDRSVPGMEQMTGPKVLKPGEKAGERTASDPTKKAAAEAAAALASLDRDPLAPLEISNESSVVSPKITQMMFDLNKDKALANEMLLDLQGMSEDDLGETEYTHIMAQASWCAPIVKWAEENLAAMMGEDEDEDDEELEESFFEVETVPGVDPADALSSEEVEAKLEAAAAASESKATPKKATPKRRAAKKTAKKSTTRRRKKKKKARK